MNGFAYASPFVCAIPLTSRRGGWQQAAGNQSLDGRAPCDRTVARRSPLKCSAKLILVQKIVTS